MDPSDRGPSRDRPLGQHGQRAPSRSDLDFARQTAQDLPLRSYQPSLTPSRQAVVPARDASLQSYQLFSDPSRREGSSRMNGNEFLARCRQEREQDNNSVGGLWGRQEEEVLAPLDRPNRDPPARTSLNRRAQHEAAARASAAAAAAAAAADDDDALAGGRDNDAISFWPDIRRRLRAEADLHNFIAECAICAESTREMMVLNCGHMMCRPCLDSVRTNMDSDDDPFHIQQRMECPFCRLPLGKKASCLRKCRDTQDRLFGIPVPTSLRDLHMFPLTLPEGGGNPKACTMCRQSRIKQGMDILFAVLLNCDERDKKLIQVPPGMTLETAEERLDDDFDPVPEVQHLMESINKLAMDPDFAKRYTGVFPQTQSLNAYVAVRKRGQTRER